MNRPNDKPDGFLLPNNKFVGLLNLQNLYDNGFPNIVNVKRFEKVENLPDKGRFSVRTAIASGNDLYLPSLLGADKQRFLDWWETPIDLEEYTFDDPKYAYSFGLQRYQTEEEREENRFVPLSQIPGLEFFWHPYFIDAPPFGATGRIVLYPDSDYRRADIDVIEPYSESILERDMKAMQHVVEVIRWWKHGSPKSFLIDSEAIPLSRKRIKEVLEIAEEVRLHLAERLEMYDSTLTIEWSYCLDSIDEPHDESNYHLCLWGLRSKWKTRVLGED